MIGPMHPGTRYQVPRYLLLFALGFFFASSLFTWYQVHIDCKHAADLCSSFVPLFVASFLTALTIDNDSSTTTIVIIVATVIDGVSDAIVDGAVPPVTMVALALTTMVAV